MGIINEAKITEEQFQLIVDVLLNIPKSPDYQMTLIKNIAKSTVHNNDIIVTNGVHWSQYDFNGPYHFNIMIKNKGILDPTQYHVYVNPRLVPAENYGMEIDADGSVSLKCSQYWVYDLTNITS
jgi:hypothetical protein